MDDLVQWLNVQLDEDERIARAAAAYDDGAAHDMEGPPGTWSCLDEAQWFGPSYQGAVIAPRIGQANSHELGAHIAVHDPARVLREIDAKRRIINDYVVTARIRDEAAARIKAAGDYPDHKDLNTWSRARTEAAVLEGPMRLLTLPYAARPGYRAEWAPTE